MAIAMPGSDQNPGPVCSPGRLANRGWRRRENSTREGTREAVDLRKSTFDRYDTGVGEGMTFAEFSQMRAEQRITQPPTIAIAPAPVDHHAAGAVAGPPRAADPRHAHADPGQRSSG